MITDDTLRDVVEQLDEALQKQGLVRRRGGLTRGIAWAEAAGRASDGGWYELRLHHRPNENRLSAGLLVYQPLSRGGRTIVLGEANDTYSSPDDWKRATCELANAVEGWLCCLPDAEMVQELREEHARGEHQRAMFEDCPPCQTELNEAIGMTVAAPMDPDGSGPR